MTRKIQYAASSAQFNYDHTRRIILTRTMLPPLGARVAMRKVVFIGLNPSSAGDDGDDPTIRRCVRFALSLGCLDMWMVNLFSLVATKPSDLSSWLDRSWDSDFAIFAGRNSDVVRHSCRDADIVIAAWGAFKHPLMQPTVDVARWRIMRDRKRDVHCLGRTLSDAPRHPLYLPANAKPSVFWSAS